MPHVFTAVTDSPWAPIRYYWRDAGVVTGLEWLTHQDDPDPTAVIRPLPELEAELAAYFEGRLRTFTIPCHLPSGTDLRSRVLRAMTQVPWGTTITYGELAARSGNPRASRAVGQICRRNRVALLIPCHRIVGMRDSGGYSGKRDGIEMTIKKGLLTLERPPAPEGVRRIES